MSTPYSGLKRITSKRLALNKLQAELYVFFLRNSNQKRHNPKQEITCNWQIRTDRVGYMDYVLLPRHLLRGIGLAQKSTLSNVADIRILRPANVAI
jgi:hypothetical protein